MARTFTPAEANSALAEVRPLVERMVAAYARVRELQEDQKELVHTIASNGSGYAVNDARGGEFAVAAAELESCLEQLTELGIQVKDAGAGLVDFPAVRDGEPVLLCWHEGEEAVAWWHDLESGFAGRRPIDWGEG